MKKILLSAAVALFATTASAVSVEDLRIYINPGHGSWTSNDRPCGTVKHGGYAPSDTVDTTGFFETNTNLQKGYALFHKLKEMGLVHNGKNALDLTQNIVMSHIEAGPFPPYTWDATSNGWVKDTSTEFNRNLSEIAAEVEFNNFDMFISIHSNAATEGTNTNYPLVLYRGTDAQEGNAGSIAMGKAVWPHLYGLGHQQWTYYSMTKMNIRGDHSFYGSTSNATYTIPEGSDYVYDETDNFSQYIDGGDSVANRVRYTGYLGVIKHGTPGFLSEGYFHTYQVARHRYMNDDVAHLEGYAYAYGVNDYFGLGYTESKAVIYGILRDMDEKFTHTYYTPNVSTNDKYLPLNNASVALLNATGDTVATYTTDDEYNGAFVFHVEPGTYSLTYSLEGYLAPDAEYTAQFTVAAGEKYYPEAFLRNENWTPPAIVYVNYPDSTAGKGYTLFPKYETKVASYDMLATQLEGKTVRRQLLRDDKLYVLALDSSNEPSVYIADLAGDTIITLGTTAAVGDVYKLSDIALTADGYLVGINKVNQAYGGETNVKGYKWENDAETGLPTGELSIWWTNNFAGNYNSGIAGEALTYDGTLAEGKMIYSARTTASNGNTRLVICSITDGAYTGYYRNNQDGTYLKTTYLGDTFEMTLSPRADDQIIFNSATVQPFEIQLNKTDAGVPTILAHMSDDAIAKASAGESYFKYADKDLMVAPKIDADGKVCGVQLFDITDGLGNAKEIAVDAAIDPVDYTYASAHGELALTLSADDLTTGATIELFLAVDGKVTKFTENDNYTTVSPEQGTANPFAYALKGSVVEGEKLSVSYSLNADATDVNIYVVNESDEVVASYGAGAQTAGDYTAEIDLMNLEEGKFTWEIEVAGVEKSTIETYASYRFYHPRGVDVDNNMESPSFGNIYVTEGMTSSSETYHSNTTTSGGLGLYAFDASVEPILNPATGKYGFTGGWELSYKVLSTKNAADLARVRVAEDGRIFVTRMTDKGDFIMYAPSFEDLVANNKFTSLFAGLTYDASTLKYTDANGNFIGAANLGFDVKGSGEDLKLIALSSNSNHWSYVFSGGSTDEYSLGNAATLPVPDNVAALTGKYTIAPATTNVEYDDRGGIWYCQYRGTPTAAQPGLVYIDADGNEKYKDLVSRGGGGVRVSPDGTKIAVASSSANPKQFSIYELIWAEDGTPALRRDYAITHGIGTNVYDIAWDLAGNIYVCGNTGEYLKAFALPRTEPAVTKAASKYSFVKTADGLVGVEGVEVDVNAPVKYYNLQGIEVDADNLNNGIYIKVQGSKSSKIYVK